MSIADFLQGLVDRHRPQVVQNPPLLIKPDGSVIDLAAQTIAWRDQPPAWRKGGYQLTTVDAFIAYVLRYRHHESLLLASGVHGGTPALRCVFNPHPAGDDESRAGRADFFATFNFPLSVEWEAWSAKAGAFMSTEKFAEFIEERVMDISVMESTDATLCDVAERLAVKCATAAEMLMLSRGISVDVQARVTQKINTGSGETQLVLTAEHKEAGSQQKVNVPGLFAIKIPIIRGGVAVKIACRLRYRVSQEKGITWAYDLYRPDRVLTEAVEADLVVVREKTALPLFYGAAAG